MKVALVARKEKGFEPFTLSLTVESEVEARELWHRFNLYSFDDSTYSFSSYVHAEANIENLGGASSIIRDIIMEAGVKP